MQWAQSLTASDDDAIKEAAYRILLRLSQSDLAQPDDVGLIYDLRPQGAVAAVANDTAQSLDQTTYVRDTEEHEEEDRRRHDDH